MLKNEINIAYDTARNLEKIVIRDAKAKANEITESIKQEKKAAVAAAVSDAEKCASEYTQKQRALIDSECSARIAKAESGAKSALLFKRSAIQEEIYKRLYEKLQDFTKTYQYADFIKKMLETIDVSSLSNDVTILVSANGTDKNAAQAFLPDADIKISDDIGIGGAIVCDKGRNMVYDLTLDDRLKTVMPEFFEISGLKVEF